MNTRQVLLPTLLLSFALAAFCFYLTLRPSRARARDAERAEQAPIATVSFARGTVEVKTSEGFWTRVSRGHHIGHGDSIRSREGTRVEVKLLEKGSRLRVEGETRLAIHASQSSVKCSIEKGGVWAEANNLDSGGAEIVLASGNIEASSRSGAFRMHRADAGTSQVSVYRGKAVVKSTDQKETGEALTPGQILTFSPGRAPVLNQDGADDPWVSGWKPQPSETGDEPEDQAGASQEPALLKRDLRDINPEIYLAVEVELKGKRSADTGFLADEVQIRKIKVRARNWDRLPAVEKVNLLNDTFDELRIRYPALKHSVILEFDDHRPKLELKYRAGLAG